MWAPASPVAVGASPFSLTPRGAIMRATAWPADLFWISRWVCEPVVSRCSGQRQPATGDSETVPLEPSLRPPFQHRCLFPRISLLKYGLSSAFPGAVSPAGWLAVGVYVWLGVGAQRQHRCMLCPLGLSSSTCLSPSWAPRPAAMFWGGIRGHCACAVCRPPRGQALLLLVLGVSLG